MGPETNHVLRVQPQTWAQAWARAPVQGQKCSHFYLTSVPGKQSFKAAT